MKSFPVDPAVRKGIRSALLAHYDRAARALPWRRDTDPYRVLVSEVMLQQTRVETVIGYYEPWLERFPSLDALADAGEEEVLKAWEGLGYYRRARNLHRAARVVREELGSRIPSSYDGLRALPGLGEYTAGAVASIAFGEPVPAVDGNVKRVLARLFDVAEPRPAWLRDRAAELVDPRRPGDWNQALMELGATVCTPRRPRCEVCPVSTWCAARSAGTQAERPAPPKKRPVPRTEIVLGVLHREGRVLLEKRPPEGLLAGMWAFPEEERQAESGGTGVEGKDAADTVRTMARARGLTPLGEPRALEPCVHRFTHLEAVYLPIAQAVAEGEEEAGRETAARKAGDEAAGEVEGGTGRRGERAWVDPADPGERALPRAQQRVMESWRASTESKQP